jgi:heme-degrading monooxygenase HmoA
VTETPLEAGQVVTVFRSRLLDEPDDRYEELNDELERRAHDLGGLVDLKSFIADDGERVTLVTFEDRASHERWANDPVHRRAQGIGRGSVYAAYSIQVADCTRVASFEAGGS